MVGYLPHATFNLNPRAASIDTPLHAYVTARLCRPHAPRRDHRHRGVARTRKALTKEIFGDEIGWLPWKKPGFELGLWLGKFCEENPEAKGVILESHGLFTWGDTPKECYETDDRHHQQGHRLVRAARPRARRIFGGAAVTPLAAAERRAIAARLMPKIRGLISARQSRSSGISTTRAAVLEFVRRKNLRPLAALGTSCPDHFLRTKIRPLVIDFDPAKPDVDAVVAGLADDDRRLSRRLSGLLRPLQAPTTRRRCATPTPWST